MLHTLPFFCFLVQFLIKPHSIPTVEIMCILFQPRAIMPFAAQAMFVLSLWNFLISSNYPWHDLSCILKAMQYKI